MNKVINKVQMANDVAMLTIEAPLIAKAFQPGTFVIARSTERGERIPLSIAGADAKQGTISIAVQAVGNTTRQIAAMQPGDMLHDVLGPLGRPIELDNYGHVMCCATGKGIATMLPLMAALRERGCTVCAVLVKPEILEDEMGEVADCVHVVERADGLAAVVENEKPARLYTAGGVRFMQQVAAMGEQAQVPTFASLNTIMLDGMGFCGACQVNIGGKRRFVCLEGPVFDASQVDFDTLAKRVENA